MYYESALSFKNFNALSFVYYTFAILFSIWSVSIYCKNIFLIIHLVL